MNFKFKKNKIKFVKPGQKIKLRGCKDASPELIEFAKWVAKQVCVEEDWDSDFAGVFQELACRRLYKLGFIGKDGESWVCPERREKPV